jgi:exodeoxyribonuclease V alpha subunit
MHHAFAITAHKRQGSQFKRVIVPVRKSRVLDLIFVYTAVTRVQMQVILAGNADGIREAVALPRESIWPAGCVRLNACESIL